jgi:hypothetical protein
MWIQRGEHNINDELSFSNHDGFVFHDSRGIESGSEEELNVVQSFVRKKSTERRLADRLHAIWSTRFRAFVYDDYSLTPGLQVLHSNG